MTSSAGCTALVAVLLAGATFAQTQTKDYRVRSWELLRLVAEKPWLLHSRWELRDQGDGFKNKIDNEDRNYYDDFRSNAEKRSAVATALNGRRRRQPTPSLGKAVTPYVGVGVLNDVGSFFDILRDNLETLASLSPEQRSTLFQEPPTVIQAPSAGGAGAGSGSGMRRLHALRPLRPTGNIRSYNRRSDLEAYGSYPGANHHDPGLLWTGLGR